MADKILKKDSIALRDFLENGFDKRGRAEAITQISESCMVQRNIVYNWIHGYSRIPALCKSKIEEIFSRNVFTDYENL